MNRRGFMKLLGLSPLAMLLKSKPSMPTYRVKSKDIPDGVPFEFFFEGERYTIKNNTAHYLPKKVIEHLESLTYYSTEYYMRHGIFEGVSKQNDERRFEITRIT